MIELKARKREVGSHKLAKAMAEGFVPGIIYGPGAEVNTAIFVNFNEFQKVYAKAGESSLIALSIEGEDKPREVLIKDLAYNPVKDTLNHVDLYQIKEGQELEVEVKLVFTGESSAVKMLGGILVKSYDTVTVRCSAKDLISEISVDLSGLKTFDDKILIKDLIVPPTIKILNEPVDVVALVSKPEEEEKPAEVAAIAAAPATEGEAVKEGGEAEPAKTEKKEKK